MTHSGRIAPRDVLDRLSEIVDGFIEDLIERLGRGFELRAASLDVGDEEHTGEEHEGGKAHPRTIRHFRALVTGAA